ncbi:hypothetical protein E6C50_02790 [Flavobacterium supellecticarium]|uniref:Uncharacterized protein n=1 Tax=Flavobacterium supellecticarium TaxID=2565924 RepID=A0A4S4A4C2_9FLAO|nr:hypothetical protein [Flavobacterium supellecticarium]THF53148.1 hypothetical protein E6C50_02790 [Flavobacterium supellecticarium]
MSSYKKYKILKILADLKRENSLRPIRYDELEFSLSAEEINDRLKYPMRDISVICDDFYTLGFIQLTSYDGQPDIVRYYITENGEQAHFDRLYLNKLWYKDNRFLIPLTVSIIAIIFPVAVSIFDTSKLERIEKLEKELDSLRVELKLNSVKNRNESVK